MSDSKQNESETQKEEPVIPKPIPTVDPFAFNSVVVGDSAENIRKKKN